MNKKRQTLIAAVGLLGVMAIISGVTVAWFSYSKTGTKDNTITAGKLKFIYTEGTNALTLQDAMPMTDEQGKNRIESFDFRVASETGSTVSIPYTVTLRVKDEAGLQLDPSVVKVWLSDQSNNELATYEAGENGIRYFQDTTPASASRVGKTLTPYTGSYNPEVSTGVYKYNERVVYNGTVPANSTGANGYNQDFRLRMWIDYDTSFINSVEDPAHCDDNSNDDEATCVAKSVNTWTGSCSDTSIDNETDCLAVKHKWIPASSHYEYPYNGKKFTVTVNVYANGETVSQNFTASEVSYTPPAGITTDCTGANATLDCALGELETRLGS